jgi:ubiquinone/menaquinone biosynthesis C-methylase UbiE
MLDLVRLSSRRLFPPGGPDLYRQVALLTELKPDMEVLDVACGEGVSLEYFVREQGAVGTGVDADPLLVERAEEFSRESGLSGRMSFQVATPDDLPFRDHSFDLVVGELGMAAQVDHDIAVQEMVRVLRPGGHLALIHMVWKAPVEEARKEVLRAHLGARPVMLVELRRILLDSGITGIHTEDWTDEDTAFRQRVRKPFPDFAELFSFQEKLSILRRAWRRWGWKGVRTVFRREAQVHRLLTQERILGLNLLKGTKGERSEEEEEPRVGEAEDGSQTAGLPLFGDQEEVGAP